MVMDNCYLFLVSCVGLALHVNAVRYLCRYEQMISNKGGQDRFLSHEY